MIIDKKDIYPKLVKGSNVKVIESRWTCSNTRKLIGQTGKFIRMRLNFCDVNINEKIHTLHREEIEKA